MDAYHLDPQTGLLYENILHPSMSLLARLLTPQIQRMIYEPITTPSPPHLTHLTVTSTTQTDFKQRNIGHASIT